MAVHHARALASSGFDAFVGVVSSETLAFVYASDIQLSDETWVKWESGVALAWGNGNVAYTGAVP